MERKQEELLLIRESGTGRNHSSSDEGESENMEIDTEESISSDSDHTVSNSDEDFKSSRLYPLMQLVKVLVKAKERREVKVLKKEKLNISTYKTCEEFIRKMKNPDVIPLQEIEIQIMLGARYDKLKEIFSIIGVALKDLYITFECCPDNNGSTLDLEDLESILDKCPNIESLTLKESYSDRGDDYECIIEDGKQFNQIRKLSLLGDESFLVSEMGLCQLVKWMPNLVSIHAGLSRQGNLDSFIEQLKQHREDGMLKYLKDLSLNDGDSKSYGEVVFFKAKHLSCLAGMNMKFETIDLNGFMYSAFPEMDDEDAEDYMSTGSLYEFLNAHRNTLKIFKLHTSTNYMREKQIEHLKFPIMNILRELSIGMKEAESIVPMKDLLETFPILESLALISDWERDDNFNRRSSDDKRNETFVYLKTGGDNRVIEFKHNCLNYNIQKPDFFNLLSTWFPQVKGISLQIRSHLGLLGILKDLRHTKIEEIVIEIDCKVCDGDNKDVEPQKAEKLSDNITLPELRSLKVIANNCKMLNHLDLYALGVLPLLALPQEWRLSQSVTISSQEKRSKLSVTNNEYY